jgi:hypothetical protein
VEKDRCARDGTETSGGQDRRHRRRAREESGHARRREVEGRALDQTEGRCENGGRERRCAGSAPRSIRPRSANDRHAGAGRRRQDDAKQVAEVRKAGDANASWERLTDFVAKDGSPLKPFAAALNTKASGQTGTPSTAGTSGATGIVFPDQQGGSGERRRNVDGGRFSQEGPRARESVEPAATAHTNADDERRRRGSVSMLSAV